MDYKIPDICEWCYKYKDNNKPPGCKEYPDGIPQTVLDSEQCDKREPIFIVHNTYYESDDDILKRRFGLK